MLKNIIEIIKILGLIALFILTFGLIDKLTSNNKEKLKKIEDDKKANDAIIDEIEKENKKIENEKEKVRENINNTNEKIDELKTKLEDTENTVKSAPLKDAVDRLRRIGR